jgi:hypothetical protein
LLIVGSSLALLLDAGQSPAHVIVLEVSPCLRVRVLLTRIVVVIDTLVVYQIVSAAATVTTWRRRVLCGLIGIFFLVIVIIVIACPIHHHVFVALYTDAKRLL